MTSVIAIDVGTSAVRAAIVNVDGMLKRLVRVERKSGHSGLVFDAGQLWADVCSALASLEAKREDDLRSLGVACHIGTVFTDETLAPLGVAGSWADTRGVDILREEYLHGLGDLRLITGRPAITGGPLPALLHLRMRHPDLYERTRWVLSPKDFLLARLTGEVVTDYTSAAYTMLSSVLDREWNAGIMRDLDLPPSIFPAQTLATEIIGHVTDVAAAYTGLPAGLCVVSGGPDGTLAATAVLGRLNTAIADIAGTTDVLVQLTKDMSSIPAAAVINPFTTSNMWSMGGATGMTGGALSRWSEILGFSSASQALEKYSSELASMPPGAAGLFMQPMLSGSRFPTWDPDERAELWGMSDHHSSEHLIRAAQEGAAYVVREGVELLSPQVGPEPVLLAGGVAKSPSAAQLRADVLGRPILVCDSENASLLGAALTALVGCGLHSSVLEPLAETSNIVRHHEPDQARASRYEVLFSEWKSMRGSPSV